MAEADPKNMFHLEKNTFLTTTAEVRTPDVEKYLEVSIKEKQFQKGTYVTILCGIHSLHDGSPGMTDFQFVGQFCSVFSHLQDRQSSVIKEMEYSLGTVMPIETLRRKRIGDTKVKYYLSDGSKAAIKAKFEDLRHGITPQFFIFATCHSFQSQINQILRSLGLTSALSIRQEKGELTEGKIYELDESQKEILQKVADEQPKNIILWGSAGTGKTILLSEVLSMKVNHYKMIGVKMRIIVCSWSATASVIGPLLKNNLLLKDLKEKYLSHLVSEENIEFVTIDDLCLDIDLKMCYPLKYINKVLETLCKDDTENYKQILMIDEVHLFPVNLFDDPNYNFDLSTIELSMSNIDLLIALNPSFNIFPDQSIAENFKPPNIDYEFIPLPTGHPNTLAKQLYVRHRSNYETAVFADHCLDLWTFFGSYYDSLNDKLDQNTLSPGREPLWVRREANVSDQEVLDFIKKEHILDHETVTLIHDVDEICNETKKEHILDDETVTLIHDDDKENKQKIDEICNENGWRYVYHKEIFGCEDQVVILFDMMKNFVPEHFTRAKKALIIVTTIG